MTDHEVTIDFGPMIDALVELTGIIADFFEELGSVLPGREVRELRDLAREHDLDLVVRGDAEIERMDGQLVARWGDYEMTRFREYDGR